MHFADTVVLAGTIHTLNDEPPLTEAAIALTGDTITAVGTAQELSPRIGPSTVVHDYGAATVVPGLTDSHTHTVSGMSIARGLDLTDVGPIQEVVARVAAEAGRDRTCGWVLGWGLDPNLFNESGFTGRVLDEATPDTPVFLRMRDAHSAIVNSAALRACSITGRETFGDASRVATDDTGVPTGYLVESSAVALAEAHIPPLGHDERVEALLSVLRSMAGTGLTGNHVLDFDPDHIPVLESAEAKQPLPVRLRLSPWVPAGSTEDDWQRLASWQGLHGRRWHVEGVKFFIDGTIDNGSAWLSRPDSHGQGTASVWTDPGDYERALAYFATRSIATCTHAIGDRGVAFVLDALGALGDTATSAAHRIEHIETVPDDTVERFVRSGVAASMQPIHGTHHTRADRSDNWSERLGAARAAQGWRCRDLRDGGATLALGSDWPITPFDPRAMMVDAILRRPAARADVAPIQPEQALTPLMALEGYTTHSARSIGAEHERGRIAPGMKADLTVLADDLLAVPPEKISDITVLASYVDGERAHLDAAATAS
ncbi:amidohydrolase [Streptomyces endophyticus]|uniref:Amidohydrolase n=1 Tax=Streptomyces endophyticus TaxID=714166 RepID=A0ABU6FA52_9ACTN|nr:amidohydrolase family protein [Streptomyces endophyticus]MEB8340916.1 amidohydrolase [Streptomyces endophyticus]